MDEISGEVNSDF